MTYGSYGYTIKYNYCTTTHILYRNMNHTSQQLLVTCILKWRKLARDFINISGITSCSLKINYSKYVAVRNLKLFSSGFGFWCLFINKQDLKHVGRYSGKELLASNVVLLISDQWLFIIDLETIDAWSGWTRLSTALAADQSDPERTYGACIMVCYGRCLIYRNLDYVHHPPRLRTGAMCNIGVRNL